MVRGLLYPLVVKHFNSLATLSFVSLISLGACAQKGGLDLDSAASQIDQSESVEAESNVMMSATDGASAAGLLAPTADQVAARIAANITTRFGACATATATGANVAAQFTDCSGPYHLAHLTGELDLAVSIDATSGAIDVHGTATGMQVNRATLDIDTTATYTIAGDTRTIVVHTDGSGVGPRGNDVEHVGDYTATWNPTTQCHTINGHWQTDISNTTIAKERSNDVDLERCAQGCPTGTVTHHFFGGASLTVTFDGTATAQWSTSRGGSGTITLQCQ